MTTEWGTNFVMRTLINDRASERPYTHDQAAKLEAALIAALAGKSGTMTEFLDLTQATIEAFEEKEFPGWPR